MMAAFMATSLSASAKSRPARTVAHRAEIPSDGAAVEWCDIPENARRARAKLVYYFIDPAYVPSLLGRKVDLSTHQPVVMARAEMRVP